MPLTRKARPGGTGGAGGQGQVQFNDGGDFGGDAGLTYNPDWNALAQGDNCQALGDNSRAAGNASKATCHNCSAEGSGCVAGYVPVACTISGTTVTIPGVDVSGDFQESDGNLGLFGLSGGAGPSAARGSITADGATFADGNTTFALKAAVTDHTAGFATMLDWTTGAHAEGLSTTAPGDHSHAEGLSTTASGNNAHAEGVGTTANGTGAHAEGQSTAAGGEYAHAEGQSTTANGQGAHAEGISTTAGGAWAHAEGVGTTASGIGAHAEGNSAAASLDGQHAFASGVFAAVGDGQGSRVVLMGETAGATPVNLGLAGGEGNRLSVRAGFTYLFTIHIVARKTDGSAHAKFVREGIVHNEGGTTALVGSVQTLGTDINTPGWAVAITADDANDALQVQVTGEATVRWVAVVRLVEVGS